MIDDRFLPRVWTDKGYYYPIFSELGITYENKNLPFTKENLKDINWAFRWRFNHSNENVDMEYINTLEQCTGLKDKNNKLIYEGDILRSESYPFKREEEDTYNYAAEVCFDKDSAEFFYWIFRTSSRVAGRSEGNTGQLNEYEWEIIGNIHENADLLKVGGK